jgi:alginate O-acetyltransferase complex protein AlgI
VIESLSFWIVLLGSVIVYWALPKRARLWFLALVSIAYLATTAPRDVKIHSYAHAAILTGCALLGFWLAPRTGAKSTWPRWLRRLVFWSLIGLPLGYLTFAKYVIPAAWWHGTEIGSYAVPLGISYICFKLIHMIVETARDPSRSGTLSAYLCNLFLFPIASAGPIERYDHFLKSRSEQLVPDDILHGLTRIIYGLIKRFVILEALFADDWRFVTRGALPERLAALGPLVMWRMAIYVFLYLYLDFSAYSDIAIGCCRLFGIRIMENFDWPILAPNIATFWRRWHMTLTGWCTSYVYMPVIGLTRRMGLATLLTFIVIGLWHGTAKSTLPWLLWGIYHGAGMIFYQYWAKLKRIYKWAWCEHWLWYGAGVAITILFVSLGTFVALAEPTSFAQAGDILKQMTIPGRHHAAI